MLEPILKVLIDGNDVTSRWWPTLKDVTVNRAARDVGDTAAIQLADPNGQTFFPPTGASLEIFMGQSQTSSGRVFEGFVDKVRSAGSKGSGRTISVDGSSVDNKSKVKSPGLRSKHDASFGDVAKEWGGKSGLTITVAGDMVGIHRDFWIMQHESFMAWGQRMARELGGSFKIIGKKGFFAPINEGISASGQALSAVNGRFGEGGNVLDWDISPVIGRPQFGKVKGRHYDILKAKWIEIDASVNDAEVDVDFRHSLGSATQGNAEQGAKSTSKDSEREKGDGSVTILGEYLAEPEAKFNLSGARPGVDGTYLIDSLNHSMSKGGGFTTSLTLKHPAGGAGKETR